MFGYEFNKPIDKIRFSSSVKKIIFNYESQFNHPLDNV